MRVSTYYLNSIFSDWRIMDIGFTGTQNGMTTNQSVATHHLLHEFDPNRVRHGMCVGADKQFHDICRSMGLYIIGHPGITSRGTVWNRADCDVDEIEPELPFLDRNTVIAQRCDILIATPEQIDEQIRSGTWSTIRRVWKLHKSAFIIYPNGIVEERGG